MRLDVQKSEKPLGFRIVGDFFFLLIFSRLHKCSTPSLLYYTIIFLKPISFLKKALCDTCNRKRRLAEWQ